MASSILLSDNGVSSGSAGIKTTGGNDGTLLLQTTTSGGTATTAIAVDTAQNVGIGATAPSSKLHVYTGSASNVFTQIGNTASAMFYGVDSAGTGYVSNNGAYPVLFQTNNTERARIDASGNLLVGTTTLPASGGTTGFGVSVDATRGQISLRANTASTAFLVAFYNTNGNVGSIQTLASATAYVTASDYRLKENIAPMTGALDKVQALKPVTYKWKIDGLDGEGFIAHELAEVCPHAVSGEKDAVETYTDEEGNEQTRPKYQGIDTSFLVATLTAAIQEQQAMIQTLTERITALEGAQA